MRCNKCNVEVKNGNICPLCHQKLDIDDIKIVTDYPPKRAKQKLPLRFLPKTIYLFVAIVTAISCIIANYCITPSVLWCWFIVATLTYGYLLIANTIYSNTEIGAKIFLQGASLIALCYIYEAIFKTAVATSYCLPIIISFMIIVSGGLLILFFKHNRSLFVSCNLISILGFIPIILYACKVTNVLAPAIISAVFGGITLILSLGFGIKRLKEQYSKVFHM